MPTYKHKPTNTIWVQWIINGKVVYLKKTDNPSIVYSDGVTYESTVPDEIVENGEDWEEYYPFVLEDHTDKLLFSFKDVMNLSDQRGHYRDFTTQDLINALKRKLNIK